MKPGAFKVSDLLGGVSKAPSRAIPQPQPVDPGSKFTPPTKAKKQVSATPFLLNLLQILLGIALGMVSVANIKPYVQITRLVFPEDGSVCVELATFPFIGGFLEAGCNTIGSGVYSLSGFVVWALFSIFELLPIAANYDVPVLSGFLGRLQASPSLPISDSDSDSVKAVKTKINTVVERSLSLLLIGCYGTYVVDLILMTWLYNPLGNTGVLNNTLLIRVLLGVFGVEIIVMALILVRNVIDPSTIKHQSASKREVREY